MAHYESYRQPQLKAMQAFYPHDQVPLVAQVKRERVSAELQRPRVRHAEAAVGQKQVA